MTIPKEIQGNRIAWAKSDAQRDKGLTMPEDVEQFCQIAYAEDGLAAHTLNVYRPKNAGDTLPLLISIHGGGWFYGDKELYRFYCAHMAQLGFVVVDCDYRLAPEYSYPAAIEDVCRVVRWSLENREKFTRNKHWFMMGDSAGAQLVSQYCILAGSPAYREQLDFCTYDQLPDGVALNCGIYDMSMDNDHTGNYTHETPAAQKNCWNRCWTT